MRILIAPDKFKGALSAHEAGEIIASGLREILPDAKVEMVALADGGEGTAEVLAEALDGRWRTCRAHGPSGSEIEAKYAWIDEKQMAVFEMSEAAGLRRVDAQKLDPDAASTFGVGEMLMAAAGQGAQEIIVGLGGSATNDGGFGLARALGFRFVSRGRELTQRVSELACLDGILPPRQRFASRVIAAADVTNPLLGRDGATHVFGPQKGVAPDKIEVFESALARLAEVAAKGLGSDRSKEPASGAAGGLGFGLTTFAGAVLRPGFEIVAEAVGLPARIAAADVIITGEGSLDRQTLRGKTAAGVARLARSAGKKVCAVAGRGDGDPAVRALFDAVELATPVGMSDADGIRQAPKLLHEAARRLATQL
jgi:glycerate kinase